MTQPLAVGAVHHIALTVSDLARSAEFYTRHFGFRPLVDLGSRQLFANGHVILAVTLPANPNESAPVDDRFSENRIGLDHVSFSVGSLADLEAAAAYLDEQGVSRGEIKDLGAGFGIYLMAVRDPDNIQLELTAPR